MLLILTLALEALWQDHISDHLKGLLLLLRCKQGLGSVWTCLQLLTNLHFISIYTLAKKILYVKITYCDYSNKNVEHSDLRITKIWVQQK